MQVGRIFTAISISSGSSSRQFSTRYTIHAGRNLPGKGLRYLRTLRVRAVVHWSLRHNLDIISATTIDLPVPDRHQLLYFPYSGLQEPMFLLNSRLKNFCCGHLRGRAYRKTYAQLFCRVPWTTITRIPWSARPVHLCRLSVRFTNTLLYKLFLES